jgi:hypothetical protein
MQVDPAVKCYPGHAHFFETTVHQEAAQPSGKESAINPGKLSCVTGNPE